MERDEVARAQGRPVPPAVPGRPVLPRRPLARARRRARLPALAHPRQGRLRDQGRARLPAPRRTSTRASYASRIHVAARRPGRHRRGLDRRAHRLARRAPLRPLRRDAPSRATVRRARLPTDYADAAPADLVGARARRARPRRSARPSSSTRRASGSTLIVERHTRRAATLAADAARAGAGGAERGAGRPPTARAARPAIRPERFARLVTLASVLIAAGRAGRRLAIAEVCEHLQISEQELREDISVLNVVNFGGGAYVLYAEVQRDGEIEVDPEPYSDTFDRPARLLPIEAKALVAAIDLIGDHLPDGRCASAREKIVARARRGPGRGGPAGRQRRPATTPRSRRVVSRAIARRAACSSSSTTRRTRTSSPSASVEPYALMNGARGLVRRRLRPGARTTCATSGWTASSAPTVLDERFEPRAEVDPVADVERLAAHRRGRRLAPARACGSRPSARAGRARSARCWPSSPTAR